MCQYKKRIKKEYKNTKWRICLILLVSSILPDEESNMISVQEDAGLAFVIEMWSKVNATYHMPTAFKLLLKTLLDILSSIFEVGYFASDHLNVNVFSDEHGVLLVLHFHVRELDFGGDGDVGWSPVFGDAGAGHLLLLLLFVCLLFFLLLSQCCHPYVIQRLFNSKLFIFAFKSISFHLLFQVSYINFFLKNFDYNFLFIVNQIIVKEQNGYKTKKG